MPRFLFTSILLLTFISLVCTSCGVQKVPHPGHPDQPAVIEEPPPDIEEERETKPELSPLEILEKQADDHAKAGDYRDAVNDYNSLLSKYPLEKREDILLKIGKVLNELEIEEIEMIMASRVNRIPESLLLYKLGLSYTARGEYSRAMDVLNEFTTKYPGHRDAQDARSILSLIRDKSFQRNKIGCILPLSGKYAVFGQKALRGIEMALGDLTRRYGDGISIVIKDSQSRDDRAVECVDELAVENVAAIAGPMITASAASSRAQEKGIPMICMTQKSEVINAGDYIFCNFLTPEIQVNGLLNHAFYLLGIRRFGVIHPENRYGITHMEHFVRIAEEMGGEVAAIESYDQDKMDFGDIVKKMVRILGKPSPSGGQKSAVFIPESPSKLALILPQFAYHDRGDIHLLGTNLWHTPLLIKESGDYIKNAVITEGFFQGSRRPEPARFSSSFTMLYKEAPGFIEAIAYDTVYILMAAAMMPDTASRVTLKNTLAGNFIYEGATGTTMFESSGMARKEIFLLNVRENQFTEINLEPEQSQEAQVYGDIP
ncbi:MAG: penicillin-binding protein activator [Desulfamplus sp.]|nr:penicillin-binding protein activator [Desulfamplus sp.]